MKCASCSADVAPHSLQCEFCGSYVEREPTQIAERVADVRQQIFARIKASPQYCDFAQNNRRKRRAAKSSPRLTPAIVVSKREEIRGDGKTLTCHFATFEFEDGRRQELSVWDEGLFQRLANEEPGLLFRRGLVATDFRSVPL